MMRIWLLLVMTAGFIDTLNASPKSLPSEVRTPKINLTMELDTYRATGYLNPAVSYTTSNEIEIGIVSYSLPIYGQPAQNFEADTYFNLSKKFRWTKQLSTIIGTQTGWSLMNNNGVHLFDYIDTRVKPLSWLLLHGGTYYVNKNLSVTTSYIGGIAGFGVKFIPDILHLTVDYYGGHSNVSGAIAQLNYFMDEKTTLSIGTGIPEKHSGNEFYGLIGVNYSY
jgi:hypothetical protein